MTAVGSVWLDRQRTSHLPVTSDASYDVVVVGAGVTGLLTALHLAHGGCSVAVLEGREVGSGTTGNSTAKVTLLQGTQYSKLSRKHPVKTVQAYAEANLEGQKWLLRFCEDHGVPYEIRPAVTYATTSQGLSSVREELEAGRKAGLPVTWTDDPGLPYPVLGAVQMEDQGQLDPIALLDAVAAQVLAAGGAIHEHSRVRTAHVRSGMVHVETDAATLVADRVVLATSMPILNRGGFFARLQPHRSYAAALRSSWTAPAMYLSADRVVRSVRTAPMPEGDDLLIVGGNGHIPGRVSSTEAQLDDLIGWAEQTFPDCKLTHSWAAQDQQTVTGLPYVGPLVPGNDRIMIATGYAKWGFTNAPAAALALSKTILGEPPHWAQAMTAWSLRELGALPTAMKFNSEVGFQIAKGLIRPFVEPHQRMPDGTGNVRWEGLHPVAESQLDGRCQRVSAVCPHLGGIVRWNDAEQSWDCPLHGSRFRADGSVLEGPATKGLQSR